MAHTDEEFRALRRTIALRGTVRVALLPLAVSSWAVLAAILLAIGQIPAGAILPLAILVAGFEAIHSLHVGVERIGRYLQVYYEADAAGPKWETTALAVGPALPGGGTDPLFSLVFLGCGAFNLSLALLAEPSGGGGFVLVLLHLAFAVRVLRARRAAARQRAVDLESYRAIYAGGSKP